MPLLIKDNEMQTIQQFIDLNCNHAVGKQLDSLFAQVAANRRREQEEAQKAAEEEGKRKRNELRTVGNETVENGLGTL